MRKIGVMALLLVLAFFTIVFYVSLTAADDEVMTVEANIMSSIKIVSIQVPDYIFFGNLTRGECSGVKNFKINNTGNVDLVVSPEIEYSSEKIFSYLYFSKYSPTNYLRIVPYGNFSVEVPKKGDSSIKVKLDLTDYPDDIPQDMIGHRADISFVAMEK